MEEKCKMNKTLLTNDQKKADQADKHENMLCYN